MQPAEVQESDVRVEDQALALVDEARSLVIADEPSYQNAALWLRERCKAVLAKVDAVFDPIIRKAHEAHKEAVAQKRIVAAPIEEAERVVKGAIGSYLREQERIRLELQRKADESARKLAEEEALMRAEALEAAGRNEEAEEVISRPLAPMPILASRSIPKAAGVTRRTNFRAEVTDLRALVRHVANHPEHLNLLQANGPSLNQLAKAMKGDLSIPGVRVVADDVVSARA